MNLLIYLGAGSAALLAIGALARGIWHISRRTVIIVDAVKELAPNGGRSIKDTVTRTERKVDETAGKVDETADGLRQLRERFDAHLADGSGPGRS
jgi:hypothetical protein